MLQTKDGSPAIALTATQAAALAMFFRRDAIHDTLSRSMHAALLADASPELREVMSLIDEHMPPPPAWDAA